MPYLIDKSLDKDLLWNNLEYLDRGMHEVLWMILINLSCLIIYLIACVPIASSLIIVLSAWVGSRRSRNNMVGQYGRADSSEHFIFRSLHVRQSLHKHVDHQCYGQISRRRSNPRYRYVYSEARTRTGSEGKRRN